MSKRLTTNENFVPLSRGKNIEDLTPDEKLFYDNVEGIKGGEIVFCMNWKQVEDLLNVFDNNEDWHIEDLGEVFIVLPSNPSGKRRAQFRTLLQQEKTIAK